MGDLQGQGMSTKGAFRDTASNLLHNQDSDGLSRRSRTEAATKDPPRELLRDLEGQGISSKRVFSDRMQSSFEIHKNQNSGDKSHTRTHPEGLLERAEE